MNAPSLLVLATILAGCGATVSESPSRNPTAPGHTTAATFQASISPAAAASQTEAGGVFVFTPGVMDCPGSPGGCPSYSVAEAIAEPGEPGIPIIVDGHVFIEADGTGWFCEEFTDSAPPQCAGERLAFDGLELMDPAAFEASDGVRWSEKMQLLGEVKP